MARKHAGWPASPTGIALISELRRCRVRIVYICKNGRVRQPIIRVAAALRHPLLFRLENPLNRGVVKRERTYAITPPQMRCRMAKHRKVKFAFDERSLAKASDIFYRQRLPKRTMKLLVQAFDAIRQHVQKEGKDARRTP